MLTLTVSIALTLLTQMVTASDNSNPLTLLTLLTLPLSTVVNTLLHIYLQYTE